MRGVSQSQYTFPFLTIVVHTRCTVIPSTSTSDSLNLLPPPLPPLPPIIHLITAHNNLPPLQSLHARFAPVKVGMEGVVCGPVDELDEGFVLGGDEPC